MSKKISELETTNTINNDDIFVISQSPEFNDSKQITKEDVFANTESEIKNTLGTDEYDNTSTYSVGDYCIYNNTLYQCTTEISVAENFNDNHWQQKQILTELTEIQEKIDLITNVITIGLTSDTTTTSTAAYQNIDVNLTKQIEKNGDKLTLNNGKVVIGAGVSKVLISGKITTYSENSTYGFTISKNTTAIVSNYEGNPGNSFSVLTINPVLLSVTEGDTIKMQIYHNVANTTKTIRSSNIGTCLTVQVIA